MSDDKLFEFDWYRWLGISLLILFCVMVFLAFSCVLGGYQLLTTWEHLYPAHIDDTLSFILMAAIIVMLYKMVKRKGSSRPFFQIEDLRAFVISIIACILKVVLSISLQLAIKDYWPDGTQLIIPYDAMAIALIMVVLFAIFKQGLRLEKEVYGFV